MLNKKGAFGSQVAENMVLFNYRLYKFSYGNFRSLLVTLTLASFWNAFAIN